jgi:hypothetical protein
MGCTVDDRATAHDAADAIRGDATVVAVDVIAPAVDPTDRWTLEITTTPDAGGVPPTILEALAVRGLTVRDVSPQGSYWKAHATV